MLIYKHRIFIGCKVDLNCMPDAMPQVILLYKRQMSSRKSDIDGDEEVMLS